MGNRLRRTASVGAALAAIGLLAGCGGDDDASTTTSAASGASGTKTVRIAYIPALGTLPIQVAREQGFFEKRGIEIEATEGSDIAAWTPALGKQFDIALSSPSLMLSAAGRGLPVQVISGLQGGDAEHRNGVMISKQPIKSLKQLEGERVGQISVGGGNYDALRYLLKKDGVDPDKVRTQATPIPTMVDQVKAGQLYAAIPAAPFFFGAEKEGLALANYDIGAAAVSAATDGKVTSTPVGFLVSTKEYIGKNEETAAEFRDALKEAIEFIDANPEKANEITLKWLKLPPALLENAEPSLLSVGVNPAAIDAWGEISLESGTIKKPAAPAEELIWSGVVDRGDGV